MTTPTYTSQFNGPANIPLKQADNNAILNGTMCMPFKPNTMTQGSGFSSQRHVYANMPTRPANTILDAPCTVTSRPRSMSQHKHISNLSCKKHSTVNYNDYAPKKTLLANYCSSDVISKKKAAAIGKSSGMNSTPANKSNALSFSSNNTKQNVYLVQSALRKCRNKGTVVPPKCSALNNPFKSGGGSCC